MNHEDLRDLRVGRLRAILTGWHGVLGEAAVSVQDIVSRVEYAPADDPFVGAVRLVAGDRSGRVEARLLGYWLRRHENRILDGYALTKSRKTRQGRLWSVGEKM